MCGWSLGINLSERIDKMMGRNKGGISEAFMK
jgi:hypothetical protein